MKIKTHINGIYKPRMRRPAIIIEDTTSSRRKPFNSMLQNLLSGIDTHYSFHNGLDEDIYVFMADGSQFMLRSAKAMNNVMVIEHSFCIRKTVGINVNLMETGQFAPLQFDDKEISAGHAQEHLELSRINTMKTIEERIGMDNRGTGLAPFNIRDHHSNITTICPEANLVFKFLREDFTEHGNIIFCKETSCVLVYGSENLPDYNPHPFHSGIDVDSFAKAATTQSGQSINISILDNSGSTSQTSFYVPMLGKEVKINTVFDDAVCESGVYITHFKVAPNGVMIKDEIETRFYTIDEAINQGLIFLTKEDAITGGSREARWKQHLVKEEFERKLYYDKLEWAHRQEEFEKKQKALETEWEKERILHELKMEADKAKAERDTKAFHEEKERQRILYEQKLEIERIKMERDTKAFQEEKERQRILFEQKIEAERVKMERETKEAEFEQKKREEEDRYDRQKKAREDANDKKSTFRKVVIDIVKAVPVALATITAALLWSAKMAAAAAV